jgi:hypothetical protein
VVLHSVCCVFVFILYCVRVFLCICIVANNIISVHPLTAYAGQAQNRGTNRVGSMHYFCECHGDSLY